MIQTMKAKVTGMKRFKGDVEGKHYDSTTVYVETRLYDKAGNRRGYASQDYPCGTSDVYARWEKIELPAEFEIDMETVTDGNTSKQIVFDLRPCKVAVKAV